MLLDTLGASNITNIMTERGINREGQGRGINRAGERVVTTGYGSRSSKMDF